MKNTAAVNNPKKPRKNAACLMTKRIMLAQKALTSVAIEGNRLAERLLADIAAGKGEDVLAFLNSDESAKNVPAKVPRNVLQNVPVNENAEKLPQVDGDFKMFEKRKSLPFYKDAPSMHLDLPNLSRYADSVGKKIVNLSTEEIEKFRI